MMLEKHLVGTKLKSETLTLEYESAKADLEKINDYIASGAIFRSKFVGMNKGENTSYFLSLEKRNKERSHIHKIINTNDVEITDEKMVLKEIKTFTVFCTEKSLLDLRMNAFIFSIYKYASAVFY